MQEIVDGKRKPETALKNKTGSTSSADDIEFMWFGDPNAILISPLPNTTPYQL